MNSRPLLDGIRVVDLTRVLAGPYCTMTLGDLGADVIKVERPGTGDDTRAWGPPFAAAGESAYFLCANRNKRSITLNLKSESGREVLADLLRTGDVVVENFRPGTLESWGFSDQRLQELRPGIIRCSITGYGLTGPDRDLPGYDFVIQARGGVMSITGPPGGDPYKVGVAIADITAGLNATCAILAALLGRERGHGGQVIDISLLDTQVAWLANVASNHLISGDTPERYGNAHASIVPYELLPARDRPIVLAVGNDGQWRRFCEATDQQAWVEDQRFATNEARVRNREILIPLLKELIGCRDADEWIDLLRTIGIPVAAVQSIDQVFSDPQVVDRGMRVEVEHPTAGLIGLVGSPLRIPTCPVEIRRAPPTLGQHTDEVLHELGLDATKIARMRDDSTI